MHGNYSGCDPEEGCFYEYEERGLRAVVLPWEPRP